MPHVGVVARGLFDKRPLVRRSGVDAAGFRDGPGLAATARW